MNLDSNTMHDLFGQLGLPNEEADVQDFINAHRHLPESVRLADADFWTPTQAQFLRDEILKDAEWAPVIDQLNVALHA